jgi:hypothetical protein
MIKLCAPAIIYLIFSTTQIMIDTYKGLYNTVAIKTIVTIMLTLLLNILCDRGLGVISWIIVFVPFILMTVIVSLLLYAFGLDVASGKAQNQTTVNNVKLDPNGNIIIYDPYYDAKINPVYYNSPNIIVPKSQKPLQPTQVSNIFGSSDPAYQT